MKKPCVIVADAARARIYELESPEVPGFGEAPKLVEVVTLVNPARRERDGEVFSASRPGLNKGAGGGPRHGFDDHRSRHVDEFERRFAADIVSAVGQASTRCGAERIVLAASPHMLGLLRDLLNRLTRQGLEVNDLAKDLTNLKPAELHDHLAAESLLPPRRRVPVR